MKTREPHKVLFLRLPLELAAKLDAHVAAKYRGATKQRVVRWMLEHELRDVVVASAAPPASASQRSPASHVTTYRGTSSSSFARDRRRAR